MKKATFKTLADKAKNYVKKDKEKWLKNPVEYHKQCIRSTTSYLIKHKVLVKKEYCEICGAWPAECHHLHYDDATSIIWVCKACHATFHRLKDD